MKIKIWKDQEETDMTFLGWTISGLMILLFVWFIFGFIDDIEKSGEETPKISTNTYQDETLSTLQEISETLDKINETLKTSNTR